MNTIVICSSCSQANKVDLKKAEGRSPLCGGCKSRLPIHENVQDLTDKTITQLVNAADRPVVIDFWADWCGPCKAFAPVFKKAAMELSDKFIFAKLDTAAHPQTATRLEIRGIPTLIVFANGAEKTRQSGALPYPALKEYLSQWL